MKEMLDGKKLKSYKGFVLGMNLRSAYTLLMKLRNADKELIVVLKQYVRQCTNNDEESLRVTVRDDGDTYLYKEVLESADNMEDAENEFQCYHKRTYVDMGYDCTGQWFTSWHKIFRINGNYVLYHSIACDC